MKSSPKFYISNAFSPSMLGGINYEVMFEFFDPENPIKGEFGITPLDAWVCSITEQYLWEYWKDDTVVSCVGHKDTAAVFSVAVEEEVPVNRIPVTLNAGDFMLIGTPTERLPEGTTQLPEGVEIRWCLAHIPVEYPAPKRITECPHCWEAL